MSCKLASTLFFLVVLQWPLLTGASHFRHGNIAWAPIDSYSNTIRFTFRLAFRRSYSSSYNCDQSTIISGSLIGSGDSWTANCDNPSCSSTTIADTGFHCTDYSSVEDWSMGENNFTYTFPSIDDEWIVSYTSCCWISLSRYGNGNWLVSASVNLNRRSDNGRINSSPVSRSPAIVRWQEGCPHSLRIPVEDPDGDVVKCRWASLAESSINTDSFPYGRLDEKTCVLTYSGSSGVAGTYAVALTLEDFPAGTTNFGSISPFSAVGLQFLVIISGYYGSCGNAPVFTATTPRDGECSEVQIGSAYRAVIEAKLADFSKHIVEIVTSSPSGMQFTPLRYHGGVYYRNVTWNPNQYQVGQQLFCFKAVDSLRMESEWRCVTILVGLSNTPRVLMGSQTPRNPISKSGPGFMWWSIQFDRVIKMPRTSSYIRLVLLPNGQTVYKVDTLSLYARISSDYTTLQFAMPNAVLSMNGSYAIMIDHGAVVGQGCSYDGPPTPGITNASHWQFGVDGVCPVGYYLAPPGFTNCADINECGSHSRSKRSPWHHCWWCGTPSSSAQINTYASYSTSSLYDITPTPVITSSTSFSSPSPSSECSSYTYLKDSVRAQGFYNGYYGFYQCDRSLAFGWYRFGGAAGTQMPTSCVGKNRCSSHAPGWLNAPHPSVDDGIVNATVCFHWNSGCCHWTKNIRVRNCSEFYVYELGPTPACWLRYCGNGGAANFLNSSSDGISSTAASYSTSSPNDITPTPVITSSASYSSLSPSSGLRLVGGNWKGEGRVEVFHNGSWGTVCDDNWDITDARIVCRELGYPDALSAPKYAHFGSGNGQIWLDDVQCQGNESSIVDCHHPGWGVENCGHSEDASVICSAGYSTSSPNDITPTPVITSSASFSSPSSSSGLRLVGGNWKREGRVEVFHNGSWGTVCDDNWDITDARIVCRELGYPDALSAPKYAHFGSGNGQIWLDDVQCQGNESSIVDCQHPGWGVENCGHSEDASVICSAITSAVAVSTSLPSSEVTHSALPISLFHVAASQIAPTTSSSMPSSLYPPSSSYALPTPLDFKLHVSADCAQICTNSPGSYSCSCVSGYRLASDGKSCSDINECATNNGGCSHHCYNIPGSFYCGCPKGTTMAANNLTCNEPGLTVKCGGNNITVSLEKQTFPFMEVSKLHLRYSSCRATENSTHFLFDTSLSGCGTLMNETKDALIFWNEIKVDAVVIDNVITRTHDINLPFYCSYSRKKMLSLSFKPQNVFFGKEVGYGNFTFRMDFYKSASFATPYTEKDYPISVPLNEYVYIKYSVESSADLVIMAENCKATKYGNFYSWPQYNIIQNGCPRDTTLDYGYDPTRSFQQFKIKTFRFFNDYDTVYFHCELLACHRYYPKSRCSRSCLSSKKRKRRGVTDDKLEHKESTSKTILTGGPILIKEKQKNAEDAGQTKQAVFVASVSAACGFCLVAVIALVVLSVKYRIARRLMNRNKVGDLYATQDDPMSRRNAYIQEDDTLQKEDSL